MTNRYRLYGITLGTNYPLSSVMERTTSNPDIYFECFQLAHKEPHDPDSLIFQYPSNNRSQTPVVSLYRRTGFDAVRYHRQGVDYHIGSETISCLNYSTEAAPVVERNLLSPVMSCWLTKHRFLPLHAAAVVVDGRALAILGSNGAGKSSLAAEMMRHGAQLLSDDLLSVSISSAGMVAHPSLPYLRLSPQIAARHVNNLDDYELTYPHGPKLVIPLAQSGLGELCSQGHRLHMIVFPGFTRETTKTGCPYQLKKLNSRASFEQLMRNCSSPKLTHAVDPYSRFKSIGVLSDSVPAYSLKRSRCVDSISQTAEFLIEKLTHSGN